MYMKIYADMCVCRKTHTHIHPQLRFISNLKANRRPHPRLYSKSERAVHGAARAFWQSTIFLSSHPCELIKRITDAHKERKISVSFRKVFNFSSFEHFLTRVEKSPEASLVYRIKQKIKNTFEIVKNLTQKCITFSF